MFLSADRLDDLLATVFDRIRKRGVVVDPAKGPTKELFGVLLHLKEPRARTSRTEMKGSIYSGLGELLWYLSGSKALDFISYYASQYEEETDDKVTVHGAYGPRLFSMRGVNQIQNVLELLRTRPSSRRAVIQLFDAEDLVEHYQNIPCTNTLQFVARGGRLHMLTSMRSNDAFLGLPH